MVKINNNDFIELEYTGKTKEEGIVFDTTSEKTAKENDIFSKDMEYGPVVICVGEGHLIRGLDKKIIGKELGKQTVELSPDEAFGKKDAKLIKLVPMSKFKKENLKPFPGLQINADGMMGVVKLVSGGRVMVDFNHQLAGRDIIYDIDVLRKVDDPETKIRSLIKLALSISDVDVKVEDNKAKVTFKREIPKEILDKIGSKIKDLVGIADIELEAEKKEK